MNKPISPPKLPRVSVPVTPELLATFQRMGKATNKGTGAAIAEWLIDTQEAAEMMAALLERARESPRVVMREMHAYALGLADETGDVLRRVAVGGDDSAPAKGPPSCNTGGKVPEKEGGKVAKPKIGSILKHGFPLQGDKK